MKRNITIISIIFLIFTIIFYGKTGNMLIDFSREAYIPYQILNKEKLTTDIFLIYGPFGYIFNSILYKLFNVNINVLINLSYILSFFSLIIFYFISQKFLEKKESVILSILFISASIFSNSTFSYTLPYSYSTLWAYFGSYVAYFLYLKNMQKTLFLTLGFIAINKIELFIPLAIFFISFEIFEKKLINIKKIFFMFIFPAIITMYFLIEKIPINSIYTNLFYIKKMISTNAINHLYKSIGVYLQKEYILNTSIIFLTIITILTLSYILYKKKYKYFSTAIIFTSLLFINLNNLFNLVIIAIFFISICLHKKHKLNKIDLTLIIFSTILNLKSITKINPLCYTNFGYIFAILTLYVLLKKISDKKWLYNFFLIFTILITIINFKYYANNPKFKTKTNQNILLKKNDNVLFDKTNEYISKNIKPNENFIVVPEGQLFNLIHKKPWKYYNSTFTPLDFETFGEANIIKKLKENKTDYIIFYPRNTKEYGAQTICFDYGVNFCTYIMDNYYRAIIIEHGHKVLIFKINEK